MLTSFAITVCPLEKCVGANQLKPLLENIEHACEAPVNTNLLLQCAGKGCHNKCRQGAKGGTRLLREYTKQLRVDHYGTHAQLFLLFNI